MIVQSKGPVYNSRYLSMHHNEKSNQLQAFCTIFPLIPYQLSRTFITY